MRCALRCLHRLQPPDTKRGDIAAWMERSGEAWAKSEADFGIKLERKPAQVRSHA